MRVAGYCRVSTGSEEQATSFAAQRQFFREYITQHEDWQLWEIYADEGISGTSIRRREAFCRMLQDARAGEFQLLLTKEVSRFSRNILDTVAYTRELKRLGIGVIFLSDGIDTRDADAELRLSIMGSIAQEESRKTSQRVKWGQQRQMERGVVFGRSLLGYRVEHGVLRVEPSGAEIVRRIFRSYAEEGKSSGTIARELEQEGIPTAYGGNHWSAGQIVRILRNEKYVGDLVQKKTYTPDYLTHQKRKNLGAEEKIVIPSHHPPLVDRTLWETAQEQLRQRNCSVHRGGSRQYPLSGKIFCGVCGGGFTARIRYRKDGDSFRRWSCAAAGSKGGCSVGVLLREDVALELIRQAMRAVPVDTGRLIQEIVQGCEMKPESDLLQKKRDAAVDAFAAGILTQEELHRVLVRYTRPPQTESRPEEIRERLEEILTLKVLPELLVRRMVERITVFPQRQVTVKLSFWPQVWTFQI